MCVSVAFVEQNAEEICCYQPSAITYLLNRVILLRIADLVRFIFAAATSASSRIEPLSSIDWPETHAHTQRNTGTARNQLIKFVFAFIVAAIALPAWCATDNTIDIGRIFVLFETLRRNYTSFSYRTDLKSVSAVAGGAGYISHSPINCTNIRLCENRMEPSISLQ